MAFRRAPPGRGALLGVAVAMALGLCLPGAAALPVREATASGPQPGEWFAYDYDIYLTNGVGNYSGYTEQTTEHYRYTIESVVGDNVTVFGHGTWTYTNNSGGNLAGGWTETFSFSESSRQYLWGFDVNGTYQNPSVWFWIPPTVHVGDRVRILDANYSVQSRSSDVWYGFPPTPRTGIELTASGAQARKDQYGNFASSWTDNYWFDVATGLLIAERYTEHDSNPAGDGFDWQELASVTSSSYAIPLDWSVVVLVYGVLPSAIVAAFVGVRWYHRGPRRLRGSSPAGLGRVTVRRVRRPGRAASLPVASSSRYAQFLPLLLRRAALRKNPVWVAQAGNQLVGAMIRDREAKVAVLYTQDATLATLFRSMHRARDFFAELPPGPWSGKAFVADTFHVLERDSPRPLPDGTADIRPMTPDDLAWVLSMAGETYRIPEPRWIRQALEDGDLAFTAWTQGKAAGFAFATVAGTTALLHTLTVTPSARGQGLGRALSVARLNALSALGVERVLVDISTQNPPSLAIARELGFQSVGEVRYFSRRVRSARPVERRPL